MAGCPGVSATFPLRHYICLMLIMLMNCMSITFIFPFSGFFVLHLGLADDSVTVGLYAGLVASMVFLGRAATNFAWGLVADKYGRKAVLLVSVVASAICMCGFGFSTSMLQMCMWRLIGGMLNGIVSIAKVVGFELTTTEEDTNRGSAWLQAAWGAGLVFGPALGGYLSEPCKEGSDLSHLFGPDNLFCSYPFALPGVVGALLHVAVLPCWFLLPETGASSSCLCGGSQKSSEAAALRREVVAHSAVLLENADSVAESVPLVVPDAATGAAAGDAAGAAVGAVAEAGSGKGLCNAQYLRMVLLNSISVCSLVMAQELSTLWCILPVSRGGPQWSAETIGKAWAFLGFGLLSLQVQFIPRLLNRLGNRRALQCGLLGSAVVQALMPWIVVISSPSNSLGSSLQEGPLDPAPLTFALFMLVAALQQFTGQLVFCPLTTLVNSSADTTHRARAMGLAMAMQSLGMAVSPTAAGAILSATVERAGDLAGDPVSAFPNGTHTGFLVSSALQVSAWLLLPKEEEPVSLNDKAAQLHSAEDLESATALTSLAATSAPSGLLEASTPASVVSVASASSSASTAATNGAASTEATEFSTRRSRRGRSARAGAMGSPARSLLRKRDGPAALDGPSGGPSDGRLDRFGAAEVQVADREPHLAKLRALSPPSPQSGREERIEVSTTSVPALPRLLSRPECASAGGTADGKRP